MFGKKQFGVLAAVAVAGLAMLSAGNAQANLIQNGDFSANAGSFATFPGYCGAGSNAGSPLDWANNNGNSGINGPGTGGWGEPFSPSTAPSFDFAFLQVNSSSNVGTALYTYFNVTPGQNYTVTYMDAARSGDTGTLYTSVENGGIGSPVMASNTTTPSDTAFQQESFNYTAGTSTQDAIIFQNTGNGSTDSTVDFSEVVIAPASSVPEPATIGLMAMAGLGLLITGRKRAVR
jgi:hypothetical protein